MRTLPLSILLDHWAAEGIITPDQAASMRTDPDLQVIAATPTCPEQHPVGSVAVEALGYLGGAITVTATLLIAARYWDDLATGWRVGLVGLAAVLLLVAGAAAPRGHGGAGDRLRAVLWLGSVGAFAGAAGILAHETFSLDGLDVALLVASATAAYASALWVANPSPAQQVAMVVAFAVTSSVLLAELDLSDDLPGLGAWGIGVAWALLGWGGLLAPRTLAVTLGSATAVVGAMLTGGSDAGTVLTLVTVAAVIAAGALMRDLLLIAVGAAGALLNIPAAVSRWFPDTLVVPYVLLVVGGALVLLAVRTARHRTAEDPTPLRRDWSIGASRTALAASGAVAAVVVAAAVAVAWL